MREKIKCWLIPQGWLSLYRRLRYRKNNTSAENIYTNTNIDYEINKERLEQFKNIHNGKRCFILASGPSINEHDLTVLKDEYCIAVSQFFLHPQIERIRPQYHCLAPQHYPFENNTNKIIFDNYIKNYTFPIKCFIGKSDYEFSYYNFLKKNTNYNINAYYIDYQTSTEIDESNYNDPDIWDITKNPFSLSTVIYEAIQLAHYMGFCEIYLLGVDHDYLNDIKRTTNHHFYDENLSYSDKEHLESISLEKWFLIYHKRWKQYRLMKEYLSSKEIKIYNASAKSLLDVFPKVRFESLFLK